MRFTVVLVCFAYLGSVRQANTSCLPATAKFDSTAPDTVKFDKVGVRRKRDLLPQWIKNLGSVIKSTFQKEPQLQKEVLTKAKFKKSWPSIKSMKGVKKVPKMVVLDLDYTMWPFWIDTHVDPPFRKDSSGTIYDLRGIKVQHYPDSNNVLEFLSENNIPISIASRTSEIEPANDLMELFDWNKYFQDKQIFPGTKDMHFKKIREKTKVDFGDMLFFDDENRNVMDLKKLGVVSILVKSGMTMKVLLDGLKEFSKLSQ